MNVSMDILVNGDIQLSDEDDDYTPLMTLQFHNGFSRVSVRTKVEIMTAALNAAIKEFGGDPTMTKVIEDNLDEIEKELEKEDGSL